MSEKENERIVKEFWDAYNRKDFHAVMEYFTEDMIFIGYSGRSFNKENFRRAFLNIISAFPDRKLSIQRLISQGNTVVVEYLWSATHKGEYREIQPTNKKVEKIYASIFDLKDNKIKIFKTYGNARSLEQQLRE
jgi:steroid delta-isomerase-like uncharacterized protein